MKNRSFAVDLKLVAQSRPHSSKKLIHPKRLCDIVVCTKIKRLNLARLVTSTKTDHAQPRARR